MSRNRQALAAWRGALSALFLGVLVPLVLFGLLAEDVWQREGIGWDERILLAVHARATPTFDAIMLLFTRIGAPLPMILFVAAILLLLFLRGRRADGLFLIGAVGGAATLNLLAKILFQRARPALWPSLSPETDYSFPSGHAMGSVAVVVSLVILLWPTRWRWMALMLGALFVAAVGLSRVYLGVHYPSDILAGWSASLAWVTGVRLVRSAAWHRLRPQVSPQPMPARAGGQLSAAGDRSSDALEAGR